jgi:TolA-binding protein
LNITRGRAITLLSCAVALSSVFVPVSLGTQFASYQRQVESLQSNLEALEACSELHRLRVTELEREAAEYESRIIELQNEIDRNDNWRTYRDRLEEAYLENARLKGLLK